MISDFHYSLTAGSITRYRPIQAGFSNSDSRVRSLLNLNNTQHHGTLSSQVKKKIRAYIDLIVSTAETKRIFLRDEKREITFKVNFITLTLPSKQQHTDQFIKREMLGQFLIEMKKAHPEVRYFWRAEKQNNGNIHFHLLTNIFYHYKEIRSTWNRITNKHGYVDAYTTKFNGISFRNYCNKVDPKNKRKANDLYRAWNRGKSEGWLNPNSTDVHSIRKIHNIAAYISKYCTKGQKEKATKELPKICVLKSKREKVYCSIEKVVELNQIINAVAGKQHGCDEYTKKFARFTITDDAAGNEVIYAAACQPQARIFTTDFTSTLYANLLHVKQHYDSPTTRIISKHFQSYSNAHNSIVTDAAQPDDKVIIRSPEEVKRSRKLEVEAQKEALRNYVREIAEEKFETPTARVRRLKRELLNHRKKLRLQRERLQLRM